MYLGNMALMNPYMTVARDLSKLHGLSAGSELAWRAVVKEAGQHRASPRRFKQRRGPGK